MDWDLGLISFYFRIKKYINFQLASKEDLLLPPTFDIISFQEFGRIKVSRKYSEYQRCFYKWIRNCQCNSSCLCFLSCLENSDKLSSPKKRSVTHYCNYYSNPHYKRWIMQPTCKRTFAEFRGGSGKSKYRKVRQGVPHEYPSTSTCSTFHNHSKELCQYHMRTTASIDHVYIQEGKEHHLELFPEKLQTIQWLNLRPTTQ